MALRINRHFYHLILNPFHNLSQILTLHLTQFSRNCTRRSMMYSATTTKLEILVNRKIIILFCFTALKINQLKFHHLGTDTILKHDGYCISEIQYQKAIGIQMQVCVELSPSIIVIPDILSILIPPQRAILNEDNTTIQNRLCSYAT